MRFCGYAYVIGIGVGWGPLGDALYFDVAFGVMGVNVAVEMACVAVFQPLGEPHFGEFDLYMVQC